MFHGLRALLIHKGTKRLYINKKAQIGLRALLIHKGTKLDELGKVDINGLRALLIHKGTKHSYTPPPYLRV